ncbi:MAG: tetratricopeptide repeat protein [Desulforhopalus sp.]
MLPFSLKNGTKSIAIITGSDPLFLKRVSEDWLVEKKRAIEREFLLLKQARVDSQTGLLNLANLYYLLDVYGSTEGLRLILVELLPRRVSAQSVLRHSLKYVSVLLNFVKKDSVLHYLGQSTFALVLQQTSDEEQPEIEGALVAYLKREGCYKVHIGSSLSRVTGEDHDQHAHGRRLLDEAWTALRHAAKRGPFSFCDFDVLAHPENHPLSPPDRNVIRRLSRRWIHSDNFCLVQFRSDNRDHAASQLIPTHIDRGVIVPDGDDLFVYLDQAKADEALKWASEILSLVCNSAEDIHVSAGVSSYPYCNFKKSEMVLNCRKAILHAAFYGKSSAALFDSVSLNISGDIYFGDGDLAKAVKEYKRGLRCDKLNINLHNSLGVALALMNKLSPAMESFETGLAIDNVNFMALYNLGLGEQARNRKKEALVYLEKALQCYSDEEGGLVLFNDLRLQLGILSCEIGKYREGLTHLLAWFSDNEKAPRAGRVQYYLGEAYHGLQNNKKAIEALQRALQFDEFDDRALDLLGRLYFIEGEGNEIALSLCRKSVELEPSNLRYLLHLAEVLLGCGLPLEARENLYRCLKNKSCKIESQIFLGESFMCEGEHKRARSWFEKVLTRENVRKDLYARAKKGALKSGRK